MLPQKIIILDTETISIEKPYVYDLGFIVARLNDKQEYEVIAQSQQIIEQVYDNRALFTTAYYENKRMRYTNMMKGKTAKKKKYGYAILHLMNMAKNVDAIMAYNAPFDRKALNFTNDFFKNKNDLNKFKWLDIHAIANNYIHLHKEYIDYAIENKWFNPSGYLQTNAERTYAFIKKDPSYKEPHTSLQDCIIEMEILNECIKYGFDNSKQLNKRFIEVGKSQIFKLNVDEKIYTFNYKKKLVHRNGNITLKK